MAEVDTWAAVDDDNDLAPPDGWPEGQMPSSVNNCGRAMMGAIRRMYDKIVNGTLALPYLPLAGGTVTGNVAMNGTGGMTLAGVQLRNISNSLLVSNATGGGISSNGPQAGVGFSDRADVSSSWVWYANGGLTYLFNSATGNVLSCNNLGALSAATSVDTPVHKIGGVTFAQRSSNAHVIYDGGGEIALALYGPASGNINYYTADNHTFQTNSGTTILTIAAGTVTFPGNISATGGTVTAQQLTSTGNINAAGTVTTVALTATGTITGVGINSNGSLGVATDGTIANNLAVGNTVSAAAFVDTTTMLSLVDMIAELRGRIEALEAA